MSIIASRLPSQWLGGQVERVAAALQEGNPLDRAVYFALIFLAFGVIVSRMFEAGNFVRNNLALVSFVGFALISVCWSDYPFIAFKRWFRDLGNYVVILVALTDPSPVETVRTVLRRLCYLLIPLSVLLIKYFPVIGRQFDPWQGTAMAVGATTSKNMLGILCLVSGLFFCWDTLARWPERRDPQVRRILFVNIVFLAMTFYLLNLANSATSRACLVLGCGVLIAVHSNFSQRRPGLIKVLVPLIFVTYVTLALGLGMNGQFAQAVGRNATLTDRTQIWATLLDMNTNPFVGTGYESFWLGPRLAAIWRHFDGLNEAHDGYLDVYLNLGGIGLLLLGSFLIASYRKICNGLDRSTCLASLGIAVWLVLLFYNITEAAFKGGLLWLMLVMCSVYIPSVESEPVLAHTQEELVCQEQWIAVGE